MEENESQKCEPCLPYSADSRHMRGKLTDSFKDGVTVSACPSPLAAFYNWRQSAGRRESVILGVVCVQN